MGGREHATGSDLGLCRSVFCLSLVCKMQAVIPSCKSGCGCVWHRVCVRDQVQAHQDVLARIGQVMPQGQEPPNPNGSGRPKLLSPSCDCLSALQLPLCCGCHSRAGADAEANYSLALRAEHTRHAWPPADRALLSQRDQGCGSTLCLPSLRVTRADGSVRLTTCAHKHMPNARHGADGSGARAGAAPAASPSHAGQPAACHRKSRQAQDRFKPRPQDQDVEADCELRPWPSRTYTCNGDGTEAVRKASFS